MSKLNVWNVNKIKEETPEEKEEKQKEEKYKPDDRIAKIYKAKRKYEKERRHAKWSKNGLIIILTKTYLFEKY